MKATVEEYDFHQRILARDDPVAFAALAEWLYIPLIEEVRKRAGFNADPVLVQDAVADVLLIYHDTPEKYDPNRASLQSYLAMAAYRDFQNARAKESRRVKPLISINDPAFQEEELAESQDTIEAIEHNMQAEELWKRIDEIFPDSTERRIVTLILNKVRSPGAYAQLLGLCNIPDDEQLRQIRLIKNRLTRRLRRRMARQIDLTGGYVQ